MKKVLIVLFFVCSLNIIAQKKTVQIMTSAECVGNCCKDRIEEEMKFTKGVTDVNLEIESQVLSITFKTKKNSLENIRSAISNLGYDADSVEANIDAYNKLPNCCKSTDD